MAPAVSDAQARSSLVTSFGNIVRQSGIAGIDGQRLSMAFRMTLDSMEPGAPFELQQLFDYLVNEQKVPEPAVVELCVILKSREARLGVQLVAPKKTQLPYLSPDKAEQIIKDFNHRVDKAIGGYEKTGEISTSGASSPSGKTTPGQKAWRPSPNEVSGSVSRKKQNQAPRSKTPLYAGILAVVVASGIGFLLYRNSTLEPEMKEVPVPADLPGFKCTHLTTNGKVAYCDIPDALAASLSQDAMNTQATMTKAGLIGAGVNLLYIRSETKQRIVFVK